uniref:FAM184 domain-containing protein n=1 Tax=Panagrellus redivivus TaxID=6233 RepID=A0A7E4UUM5_PANRE
MDNYSDAGDISFVRHEEIRDSLMPLVNDAVEKIKKQFLESRASATFINAVKSATYRDSDVIRVVAEFDGAVMSFENMSVEQMKFTLQSYADKTKSALQDSAMNLDRVLSLQAKLSASETANKRLSDSLANLENFLVTTLETVGQREVTRINSVKETDQMNSRLTSEKKALSSKLAETTKQLNDKAAMLRQLEVSSQELKSDLEEESRRANKASDELTITRRMLEETRQREESLREKLQEVEECRRQEANARKHEGHEAQAQVARLQRDMQKLVDDHAKQMTDRESYHRKKNREVVDDCNEQLRKHKAQAKDAVIKACSETERFREERDLYFEKYKELLTDLNNHKDKITSAVQSKLIEHHRRIFSEMNAERAKTTRAMQQPIRQLPSPHLGPALMDDLQSTASSSDHQAIQDENTRPAPQAVSTRRGVPKVARSFSAVGRFPGAVNRR